MDGWNTIYFGTLPYDGTASSVTLTTDENNANKKTGTVTNKYSEVTAQPEAIKELSGRDWKEGDAFTFTIAAYGDNTTDAITIGKVVMPTTLTATANSTNHSAVFNNITFKDAGTYYFKIVENEGNDKALTYSKKEVVATVTVTRGSDNTLTSAVTYQQMKRDDGEDEMQENNNTFTNTYPKTEVPVLKVWSPLKPEFVASVELTLYTDLASTTRAVDANGNVVESITLNGNEEAAWTSKFTNLPEKDSDGNAITYYVKETRVNYITGTEPTFIDGAKVSNLFGAGVKNVDGVQTITNTYDTTSITVEKKWTGNEWPNDVSEVVVTLKAGEQAADVTEANNGHNAQVTLNSETRTATWINLPVKDVNGEAISYTVVETSVKMGDVTYTAESSPLKLEDMFTISSETTENKTTITNTKHTGKIVVTKLVQLNGTPDTEATDKTFWVAVYSDQNATTRVAGPSMITIGATGSGTVEFTDLIPGTYYVYELTGENGTPVTTESGVIDGVTYTVTTENTDAVITIADLEGTSTITNNKTEKGTLTVNKVTLYNDEPDATVSGKTIKIGLYSDAGTTAVKDPTDETKNYVKEITLGEIGSGTVSFAELDYGTYYVYEIDDSGNPVTGASATINGIVYMVDQNGTSVNLQHGAETQAQTITIRNKTSEEGKLTVTKQLMLNGAVTNATEDKTFTVGLYEFDNVDENWVAVKDPADATKNWTKAIEINAGSNSGTAVFEPLTVGKTYRVYELDESGANVGAHYGEYTVTYSAENGESVENIETVEIVRGNSQKAIRVTNNKETAEIKAKKNWPEGQTLPTGVSVTLTLSAKTGDTTVDLTDLGVTPASITLPNEDELRWDAIWSNLPRFHNGVEVAYTVTETEYKIGEKNYTVAIADEPPTTGYDFSFTNDLPKIDIPVEKTWTGVTPGAEDYVEFTLYKGETKYEQEGLLNPIQLKANADWKGSFANLPMYDADGSEITWTVKETKVKLGNSELTDSDKIAAVYGGEKSGTVSSTAESLNITINNTPATTTLVGTKFWNTVLAHENPVLKLTRTVTTKNGENEDVNNTEEVIVTEGQPGWEGTTFTYSNLPKYDKDGNEYKYAVSETGFTVTIDSKTVTYTVGADGKVTSDPADAPAFKVVQGENTITNTELVDIPVTKAWTGGVDENKVTSISYKITRSITVDGTTTLDNDFEETVPVNTVPWGYTWKDLDAYGKIGAVSGEFDYTVEETGFVYDEVTYVIEDGKVYVSSGDTTKTPTEVFIFSKAEDENQFTNTLNLTTFEFTKDWKINDSSRTWLNDMALQFTLSREIYEGGSVDANGIQVDGNWNPDTSFTEVVFTVDKNGLIKGDASGLHLAVKTKESGAPEYPYTFVISDLIAKHDGKLVRYKVVENTKIDGYQDAKYTTNGTDRGAAAYDKGTVVNEAISIALPSTGGPGTKFLYAAGISLIALAVIGLFFKKKR